MRRRRRNHTVAFKAKVALAAVKRLVADLTLDRHILQEVLKKKDRSRRFIGRKALSSD